METREAQILVLIEIVTCLVVFVLFLSLWLYSTISSWELLPRPLWLQLILVVLNIYGIVSAVKHIRPTWEKIQTYNWGARK